MAELKPWPQGKTAIICCRPDDPYWDRTPGSVERTCYNCGLPVMASPASVAIEGVEPNEYLCVQCHKEYVDSSGKRTRVLPRSPVQAKEQGLNMSSREEFIASYVHVKIQAGVAKEIEIPELTKLAGQVYDVLADNSPEGHDKFTQALQEVCERVVQKNEEPPST
jgi:hypothetical protein